MVVISNIYTFVIINTQAFNNLHSIHTFTSIPSKYKNYGLKITSVLLSHWIMLSAHSLIISLSPAYYHSKLSLLIKVELHNCITVFLQTGHPLDLRKIRSEMLFYPYSAANSMEDGELVYLFNGLTVEWITVYQSIQ